MTSTLATRPHFVYRAYDDAGRCLYVGYTSQLGKRRRAHELHSPWFAEVARCVMTGPLPRSAALALEHQLIWTIRPLHNKPRWPWPRVT
jgi:hypothetical protein